LQSIEKLKSKYNKLKCIKLLKNYTKRTMDHLVLELKLYTNLMETSNLQNKT